MLAALWDSQPDGTVVCRLCAHRCRLRKGAKGICGVRVNIRGEMVSLVSRVVTAAAMDPIEKKPLYHFLPGSKIFSVGSAWCDFSCHFCQNNNIAHVPESSIVPGKRVAPEDLLAHAQANRVQSMAFTYNEPTVFFELLYETAGMAAKKGIRSVLVTNGYMSKDCLSAMSRCICAANVDLKSFSEAFYRKNIAAGTFSPCWKISRRLKNSVGGLRSQPWLSPVSMMVRRKWKRWQPLSVTSWGRIPRGM